MIARWDFSSSAQLATDSVRAQALTINGDTRFSPRAGGSLQLDGAPGTSFDIPGAAALLERPTLTIAFWMKASDLAADTPLFQALFGDTAVAPALDAQWNHFAITRERDAAGEVVQTLYFNGAAVPGWSPSAALLTVTDNDSLRFGAGWKGYFDDVRVYSTALGSAGVAYLFASQANQNPSPFVFVAHNPASITADLGSAIYEGAKNALATYKELGFRDPALATAYAAQEECPDFPNDDCVFYPYRLPKKKYFVVNISSNADCGTSAGNESACPGTPPPSDGTPPEETESTLGFYIPYPAGTGAADPVFTAPRPYLVVCDVPPETRQDQEPSAVLAHELFHGVQFAYPAVAAIKESDLENASFFLEGTAVVAETQITTGAIGRNEVFQPRPTGLGLGQNNSCIGSYAYEAQDFWVHWLKNGGRSLGTLHGLMEAAPEISLGGINAAMSAIGAAPLPEAHWDWILSEGADLSTLSLTKQYLVKPRIALGGTGPLRMEAGSAALLTLEPSAEAKKFNQTDPFAPLAAAVVALTGNANVLPPEDKRVAIKVQASSALRIQSSLDGLSGDLSLNEWHIGTHPLENAESEREILIDNPSLTANSGPIQVALATPCKPETPVRDNESYACTACPSTTPLFQPELRMNDPIDPFRGSCSACPADRPTFENPSEIPAAERAQNPYGRCVANSCTACAGRTTGAVVYASSVRTDPFGAQYTDCEAAWSSLGTGCAGQRVEVTTTGEVNSCGNSRPADCEGTPDAGRESTAQCTFMTSFKAVCKWGTDGTPFFVGRGPTTLTVPEAGGAQELYCGFFDIYGQNNVGWYIYSAVWQDSCSAP
jgi:hypothetical protein